LTNANLQVIADQTAEVYGPGIVHPDAGHTLQSARIEQAMPANDDGTYDVGFGRPPKHSRFRRGVSGNPKGRPKGRRNLATILERTLQEKVVINENGMPRTFTKLEVALRRLVDKATSGDLSALRQLTALARSAEDQALNPPTRELPEADLKVMQGVLRRLEGCVKGEASED
jgi:hypothetical protein